MYLHVTGTESDLPLSQLKPGASGTVSAVSCQGCHPLKRRFADLGLIPGAQVECLSVSPLGDPSAYRIRGAVVALRSEDADAVRVTL